MKKYIYLLLIAFIGIIPSACNEDFLDRPPMDNYVIDTWYQTAEQLRLAVNPLYGAVWFDFQRSWINIGDVLAGNYNKGEGEAFYTFSINQSSGGVADSYNSLWMSVAYSSSVIENIRQRTPETIDAEARNTALGEALVWKSMSYFYLVRTWGDVPIIESNSQLIASGEANSVSKNTKESVYEYIVRLLTEAAELLPEQNEPGRINKYSAYGLLAKVYLTRSGLNGSGTRKQEDLDLAKTYAEKVINESGLILEPEYSNLFTISKGNRNPENLISWHWIITPSWGTQNAMQADLAPSGLSGVGDGWGTWSGPSIYLQSLFGEDAKKVGASNRQNTDKRRKVTMMMDGDYYPELQQNLGGLPVSWDKGGGVFSSPSGANARKHIVGNVEDHKRETNGTPLEFMKTNLSTHLLRLADVYLVYAEAILGNAATTSDGEALRAFNLVRKRAIPSHTDVTAISFNDIFEERKRELAFEGDNWYDYVRLHYYKPSEAIERLASQERGYYDGDATTPEIELQSKHYTPDESDFSFPYPETDLLKNINLTKEPVPYDFSTMDSQ